MDEQQGSAQRRYRRVEARIPVRISTIEPERDPWTGRPFFRATEDTSGNISEGGAFVHTAEPLKPGRRVLVEFQLPDGAPIEAIGRIAWTKRVLAPDARDREAGVGIEFMGGVPEQLDELHAFLDDHSDA
ncbi:MAG: PilZ domain-containing protein [Myxococcota bacterium]